MFFVYLFVIQTTARTMVQSSATLRKQFEAEKRGQRSKASESKSNDADKDVKQKKNVTQKKLSKYGVSNVVLQGKAKKKGRKNKGLSLLSAHVIGSLVPTR